MTNPTIINWCPGDQCDPCVTGIDRSIILYNDFGTVWNIDVAAGTFKRNVQTDQIVSGIPLTEGPLDSQLGTTDNPPVEANSQAVGNLNNGRMTLHSGNNPDFPDYQTTAAHLDIQIGVEVIGRYQIETLERHYYYNATLYVPLGTTALTFQAEESVPARTDPMLSSNGPTFPIT